MNHHQNSIFHQLDNFIKHSHSFAMTIFKSLVVTYGIVEPSMKDAKPELAYQFEREGYFCRDSEASDSLVFNKTVACSKWSFFPGFSRVNKRSYSLNSALRAVLASTK
jgi:hypothetical protein